jgi:hypothetical protein
LLFTVMGGLFLAVLIPQNLVYLGVPVGISAWLLLAAALASIWLSRRKLLGGIKSCCSDAETWTLALVISN